MTKRSGKAATVTADVPEFVKLWEDAERPSMNRAKYPTDTLIAELVKTAETGKAKLLEVDDAMLRRLHMHFRNAIRKKDLSFHFKTVSPGKMLMWADKVKETAK